ncbi:MULTISPECIES: Mur ligase family protein [unclassified Synechocystis]|uniref:Mur ligase family protein n=1 Tax=unclassified Synechocystis TaxID=2640012 RepID=UPI0003FB7346|nr:MULTISPECIES: Mur ligase family protein [unclassified Synechocystis]AIE74577.1 putative amino acid ligase found clustered with an amidotransferase [Synechocystis sp. PCC 6714]MCT0254059.1 Mur ligase family protein [Synechocystis sp. CS-94]
MSNLSIADGIRLGIAVGVAKTVTAVVKALRLGSASVLPGEIARRLHPKMLGLLAQQVSQGVILVVGTNGKTTTSLLLRKILVDQGYQVTHNATGANLINGLITALLADANLFGRLSTDFAILEVDENVLPLVLKDCQPRAILALNLFRDQLDRYGEVDSISQRWQKAIAPLPTDTIIAVNADDPTLSHLGQRLTQQVCYFGLSEPDLYLEEIPHAVDSIYCPQCGTSLDYQGVYLSHLGDFQCPSCGFHKSQPAFHSSEWPQILIGVYNKYNTLAAGLVAQQLGINTEKIFNNIRSFKAAFGRAEELNVDGKHVRILLSKNPVGLNETIRAVNDLKLEGQCSTTLLVLNDRIADGTDVSWIWDVDTEPLVASGGTFVVSGDRLYDMALRLQYSQENLIQPGQAEEPWDGQVSRLILEENLEKAVQIALELTPEEETLHIIPTYTAMLEVRGILTGRKIL